jgi:hypothetical protein
MSDRNWDAEMKKIDQQLASLTDDQLRPRAPSAPVSAAGAPPRSLPAGATSPSVASPAPPASAGGAWWAYLRAALALGGVAGLVLWPYARSCGRFGIAYLAGAGVVGLLGVWTTVGAWRRRAALAHLLGLAAIATAGTLAALEVLPKVGYAIPSAAHGATWQCDAPALPVPSTGTPLTAPPAGEPAASGPPSAPEPTPSPSAAPVKL